MGDLTKNTLLVVGALFPIVNPIGNTPIFLSLTRGLSGHGRAALARMVALNGLMLILASIFIGTHILAFFGISLPVVQVGGGLIVISTGWTLLRQSGDGGAEKDPHRECDEADYASKAFYPLTLPLTVGPGSISVAMTLGANPPGGIRPLVTTALAHIVGVFVVAVSIYLCYRYADRILRKLGTTGTNVLIRLTAFILFCIGVQIMWNGLRAMLMSLPRL